MRLLLLTLACVAALAAPAYAQNYQVVTSCTGITVPSMVSGSPGYMDRQGRICESSAAAPVTAGTYTASTSASVATTSGTLFAAGAYTRSLTLCTLPSSTTNVWLNPTGAAAVASAGVPIWAGGGCTTFGTTALPMPTSAVTAITDGATAQTLTVAGG